MIPKDILIQIFEKLPVESLLRFKCVSKVWYNMIEDQEFVDGFRVRAHNHGTNLLVRKSRFQKNTDEENNTGVNHSQVYTFFLVDSEGKSVPLAFPDILRETSFRLHQPVEGLLCCNNIIWNPTTRKFIDLPPRNQMPDAWKISEKMGTTRGEFLVYDGKKKEFYNEGVSWRGFCKWGSSHFQNASSLSSHSLNASWN